MLFAHGARFGGHALYVKDNRLHYVNNFVGSDEQKVVGTEDVPTGDGHDPVGVIREGRRGPARCAHGDLSLFHGDKKVGEGRIKTSPARSHRRRGTVRRARRRRTGHRRLPRRAALALHRRHDQRVAVDVSGEPYIDLEREAVAMLARE